MGIVRTVPLKDATSTALTSCGEGTIYDVGGLPAGESKKAYAGLHILTSSTGGVRFRIQNSSSSEDGGGAPMADVFTFTSCEQRSGEFLTPLTTGTITSTEKRYWRAIWEMTTSGESYKALTWMRIQ